MPSGQRSKSGCWTCRLRRKKCLEGGPPCSNCESRGIFCHGYGPKPNWKDRGDREREEANRLQLQTRRRRRSTATQSHASHPSVSESSTSSGGTIDIGSPPIPAAESAESPSLSPFLSSDFSFPLSPSSGHERNAAIEFEFLDALTIAPDSLTAPYNDDIWASHGHTDAAMVDISPLEPTALQRLPGVSEHSKQPSEVPTPLSLSCLGDSGTGSGMHGPPTSENDIELVMHFIGETCPLQHGSYRSSSATQRSWALFLLMRSPTFYHTSLSMSAYHMSLTLAGHSDARATAVHDYQSHRAQALDSFCELMDPNRQRSGGVFGESLICSVQLALLEALGKNMQSCHSYLSSAVQILLDDLRQASTCDSGTNTPSLAQSQQQQLPLSLPLGTSSPTPPGPSPMEQTALSFFRAILIWNDILSSSSLKKVPSAAASYRDLLTSSPSFCASFQSTTGCEPWILVAIMDATALEVWKRDQENQGNLSIRELVNRASRLENTVEESIQRLEGSGSNSSLQSLVFCYALLTHLHSIVSGPLVSVPEISESIERSIAVWKRIPESISPRSLAWPYCVCASLATREQREVFREFLVPDRLSSVDSTLGSLRELKAVVEECWRQVDGVKRGSDFMSGESNGGGRDRSLSSSSVKVDWREVMQRSNLGLLFT